MGVPYAGIGARATPPSVLVRMETAARHLAEVGYVLRSGHAPGADQAFERGAAGRAEIFLPWPNYENNVPVQGVRVEPKASTVALDAFVMRYHPAVHRLSQGARKLMQRNACQVLGADLLSPSCFVLCWTPAGAVTGGTGQALRIALDYGVKVFNLFHDDAEVQLASWLRERFAR